MPKANFTQLKTISDLLKEVEHLESQINSAEADLNKTKDYYKNQEGVVEAKMLSESKQRILLEAFEQEILDLCEQETELRENLTNKISKAVGNYLQSGSFVEFVADLLARIAAKYKSYKVIAGKNAKKLLPTGQTSEESQSEDELKIDLGYKVYVLDLDKLSLEITRKLLTKQVSKVAA